MTDHNLLSEAIVKGALDAIVVVDESGTILLANEAVGRLLGRSPSGLVGRPVETLVPERFPDHAGQRAGYAGNPVPRAMGRGVLLFARHADGREIPVDISLNPVDVEGRTLVAAAMRDLRDRSYDLETLKVQATALRSAANGVVITDAWGTITWVNPAACAMTGYSAIELVGKHTRLLKSGEHGPEFYATLWRTIARGETWSGTIVNRRKDGTLYHEEQTIAPVVDDRGAVTHFIAIKRDVTEERRLQEDLARVNEELTGRMVEIEALNERLRDQALRDPLTQLHNRRYMDEAVEVEVARVTREGKALSIAVLDLDHFKEVNDDRGHAAGDRVLQRLADSLRAFVRTSDLVCRLGGDEFVVVMPGACLEVAAERAESWRRHFAAGSTEICEGVRFPSTLSIGVAQYRPGGEAICDTMRRTDVALYEAKEAGRNRVVCSPEAASPAAQDSP